jgi:putative RNA 2'-phosphotransferase
MITEKENVRISKFLSLALRHKPEAIDISLDASGWTEVDKLLQQMNLNGFLITKEILKHIVDTNEKKRFTFNQNETLIRASQGHSVEIELGYSKKQPPEILFHGTAESSIASILESGLTKQSRHHVHLSVEIKTASNVGHRYGKPVILAIEALQMFNDGFDFYLSDNGVWLTDHVPVKYLSVYN